MIRFVPDDWIDVVMRPLDMAAPEANTYVEIAAPDVRLAAALLLCVLMLVFWRKRAAGPASATVWLLALLLVSMAMWLATTGNGRYFIAWLIMLGPLCVGAIRLLPATRSAKLSIAVGLVGLQLFVMTQNSPFSSWAWMNWDEPPYFQIDTPPAEPATYVTIASITYSLVAPRFPAQSRWINLAAGTSRRDAPVVEQLLASSQRLVLFAPALPSRTQPDGRPVEEAVEALGRLLQPHGLHISADCRLLAADGMRRIIQRQGASKPDAESRKKYGFWLCPMQYRPAPVSAPPEVDAGLAARFAAVESLCPRFFAAGGTPLKIGGGWVKNYESDTKVYLLDDGTAYYKFWRSLNAVKIGTGEQMRAGQAHIDCSRIRAPNWRRGGP